MCQKIYAISLLTYLIRLTRLPTRKHITSPGSWSFPTLSAAPNYAWTLTPHSMNSWGSWENSRPWRGQCRSQRLTIRRKSRNARFYDRISWRRGQMMRVYYENWIKSKDREPLWKKREWESQKRRRGRKVFCKDSGGIHGKKKMGIFGDN